MNNIKFGHKQSGEIVNNVELPQWADDNAYVFTQTLRECIESPQVSESIHNWIDLIFGYKQKDVEGEKALNIFNACSYEDFDGFE